MGGMWAVADPYLSIIHCVWGTLTSRGPNEPCGVPAIHLYLTFPLPQPAPGTQNPPNPWQPNVCMYSAWPQSDDGRRPLEFSGIHNSTTCIHAVEPQHQLFHVSGKALLGIVTNCPLCTKGTSAPSPPSWVHGQDQASFTLALGRFLLVSLTSVLNPSLSLECTPPPRAQEPAMFDRGTRGWFLHMTVGSPVPRKKKISGALRRGIHALCLPRHPAIRQHLFN